MFLLVTVAVRDAHVAGAVAVRAAQVVGERSGAHELGAVLLVRVCSPRSVILRSTHVGPESLQLILGTTIVRPGSMVIGHCCFSVWVKKMFHRDHVWLSCAQVVKGRKSKGTRPCQGWCDDF